MLCTLGLMYIRPGCGHMLHLVRGLRAHYCWGDSCSEPLLKLPSVTFCQRHDMQSVESP